MWSRRQMRDKGRCDYSTVKPCRGWRDSQRWCRHQAVREPPPRTGSHHRVFYWRQPEPPRSQCNWGTNHFPLLALLWALRGRPLAGDHKMPKDVLLHRVQSHFLTVIYSPWDLWEKGTHNAMPTLDTLPDRSPWFWFYHRFSGDPFMAATQAIQEERR